MKSEYKLIPLKELKEKDAKTFTDVFSVSDKRFNECDNIATKIFGKTGETSFHQQFFELEKEFKPENANELILMAMIFGVKTTAEIKNIMSQSESKSSMKRITSKFKDNNNEEVGVEILTPKGAPEEEVILADRISKEYSDFVHQITHQLLDDFKNKNEQHAHVIISSSVMTGFFNGFLASIKKGNNIEKNNAIKAD